MRCANKISIKGISDAFISILIAGPIFYSIGNVIIHTQKKVQKTSRNKGSLREKFMVRDNKLNDPIVC